MQEPVVPGRRDHGPGRLLTPTVSQASSEQETAAGQLARRSEQRVFGQLGQPLDIGHDDGRQPRLGAVGEEHRRSRATEPS